MKTAQSNPIRIIVALLTISVAGCQRTSSDDPAADGEASIMDVTGENFGSVVLTSDRPVVAEFWAPWCGPCQLMKPVLRQLARETGDAVVVAKINVDDNQPIAREYGVASIPTVIIFHQGEPVERFTGPVSQQTLEDALASLDSP